MNLNEFREAMASDATKENEELKKEIESLKKKYLKTPSIFIAAVILSLKN